MYNVGDIVGNSNLLVVNNYRNGTYYICRCNICGKQDVYSKREIEHGDTKCHICENSKKDTIIGDYERVMELERRCTEGLKRAGSEYITELCNIPHLYIGLSFEGLQIKSFIGLLEKGSNGSYSVGNAIKTVLWCPICKKYHKIVKLEDTEKYRNEQCPNCSKILEQAQKRINDLREKQNKHIKTLKKNDADKKKEHELIKVKSLIDVKHPEKIDENIMLINKLNPNLVIQEVNRNKSSYDTVCTCKLCGEQLTITGKANDIKVECPGCKKKRINPNYTGIYNRNYVGCSFNNLIVIEQYGDLCTVQCRWHACGKKQENVKLYDLINRKIYCDCKYNNIDWLICEHCNALIEMPVDKLMKLKDDEEVTCWYCHKNTGLTASDFKSELILEDKRISSKNKLKIAGKDFKSKVVIPSNSELIYEKEPLYVGTLDGKEYYRCRCTIHNLDFILNKDEIANFDHEQCFDARSHLLPKLDADDLTL